MIDIINNFFHISLLNKEMDLIDVYFAKLFDFRVKYSFINMLFASIVSLSNRLGHVCLPISEILNYKIFSINIIRFLYYFFSVFSINFCINILYQYNIISSFFLYQNTPFILYKDCIYLYKFWFYENYVVNYINKNKNIFTLIKEKNIKVLIKYFDYLKLNNEQISAILSAVVNKISIITGNPGTGKTTLISKLVIILYKIFNFKHKNCIAIITPTGKSASCLTEYLSGIYSSLNIKYSFYKILPVRAYTIHKFLGFNYIKNIIKYNIDNKLNINVLIIDECSMVDLTTFYYIFSALNNNVKVILLGDSNQIGPVEAGALFNEICNIYINNKNFIINDIKYYINYLKKNNKKKKYYNMCFLKNNYRILKNNFLGKLANLIQNTEIKKIDLFLKKKKFSKNFNFYDSDVFSFDFLLKLCIKYYSKYINSINEIELNYHNIHNFYKKFQLICAIKETQFGINYFNKFINMFFLKNRIVKNIFYNKLHNCYHYYGEPIIILKNNDDLNLFNGDLGFFIFLENKLKVFFLKSISNINIINSNSLPTWYNSWAITIHKSQGSEYDKILLILPNYYIPLLNKNLIYTAITRAKKKVIIYAKKDILLSSINNNYYFCSNIKSKIQI